MKTKLYLTGLLLVGLLTALQDADAACKKEKVKLTVNEHGLWLKPDGGKCMPVADPADFSFTFAIELKTPGAYSLRDGQVHVRQAVAKEVNGVPVDCSSDLEFEESEYTNTGEDDIEVTVVGEGSAIGDSICYEIVVDDIGILDPRATVEDQVSMMGNLAAELKALLGAFDVLVNSGLGDSLTGVSVDEFLQDNYDMTEDEARALIREFGK